MQRPVVVMVNARKTAHVSVILDTKEKIVQVCICKTYINSFYTTILQIFYLLLEVTCNPATSCNGNGQCKNDGTCKCDSGYLGTDCSSMYLFLINRFNISTY